MRSIQHSLKAVVAASLLVAGGWPTAQGQTLSLQACLDSAELHLPVLRQEPLVQQTLQNKLSEYRNQNLPQINFNGQVTYQSAVPELPFSLPGMPGLDLPNTQFRTYLEVSQPLYTGGVSKALSSVESAQASYQIEQLELPALAVKKQVTEVYFTWVETGQQKEALLETLKLLHEQEKTLESALKNGVAQENDLLRLQAELVRLEHHQKTIDERRKGAKEILSLLCGFDTEPYELQATDPSFATEGLSINQNPEIQLHVVQKNSLSATQALLDAQRRPKVFAFGQTGIGQPNPYNLFESDVSGFYLVGVKMQWTLTDWGTTQKEKENLRLGMEKVDVLSEQKALEIKARISRLETDLTALTTQLGMDDKLAQIHEKMVTNAKKQYEEGIITFTKYLEEVLVLKQLEIDKANHRAQWLKTQNLLQLEYGNL